MDIIGYLALQDNRPLILNKGCKHYIVILQESTIILPFQRKKKNMFYLSFHIKRNNVRM